MLEYNVYDRKDRLSNAIGNLGIGTISQEYHFKVDKLLEKHKDR